MRAKLGVAVGGSGQIAIVVVHLANQRADVAGVFERVSGTSGLIGVIDSLMVLQRPRGEDVCTLSVTGRDVEDQTIALGFNAGCGARPMTA